MVKIFYGPDIEFRKIIPQNIKPKILTQIMNEIESKSKKITLSMEEGKEQKVKPKRKKSINNFVTNSNEYSRLSDSGINGFLTIFEEYTIKNMYFQNPLELIVSQLKNSNLGKIDVIKHKFKKISEDDVKIFLSEFNSNILGQKNALVKIFNSLYRVVKSYNEKKPIVMLFYGPAGVGKTERAKYIANLLKENLFRKQLSMYQNNFFADYLFGANHNISSLARDLLERESNVILFDEFDKPNPIFYSAFYQMFDEGLCVDKNYKVDLYDSIIICTSNFLDLNDIRKSLGEPVFSRIDTFIKYEEIDEINAKKY